MEGLHSTGISLEQQRLRKYYSLIFDFLCRKHAFRRKIYRLDGYQKGFLWAIFIWSIGAILHAFCGIATAGYLTGNWFVGFEESKEIISNISDVSLVISTSVTLFIFARFVLAVGESANFPASIKATAEYFPKKTGLYLQVFLMLEQLLEL